MTSTIDSRATGRLLPLLRAVAAALLRIPRARAFLPIGLWMMLIWLVSSLEGGRGEGFGLAGVFVGNLGHSAVFGLLSLLLVLVLPRQAGWVRLNRRSFGLVAAIAIGYGFVDEVHQSTVAGRDASLLDLVTDAIGVFCVLKIIAYVSSPEATSQGLWVRLLYSVFLCCFAAAVGTLYTYLHTQGPWF